MTLETTDRILNQIANIINEIRELEVELKTLRAQKGSLARCNCEEPHEQDTIMICTNCGGYAP